MSNFTPEQVQEILDLYFENFAHRQYIGARYVPIFGRKGETSIEWDNSAPYEPLTIVLYQGNSYTSRQFVPAGVEITNTAYWAETGNYNAQVEQYRQEVLQYEQEVDALKDAPLAFATVADMQDSNDLKTGTKCHTSGFRTTGKGAAWYEIKNTGTANGYDVIACGSLFAHLIVGEVADVDQFGAYGDGETDDSAVINYCVTKYDNVSGNGEYMCNNPIVIGEKKRVQINKIVSSGNYAVKINGPYAVFEFERIDAQKSGILLVDDDGKWVCNCRILGESMITLEHGIELRSIGNVLDTTTGVFNNIINVQTIGWRKEIVENVFPTTDDFYGVFIRSVNTNSYVNENTFNVKWIHNYTCGVFAHKNATRNIMNETSFELNKIGVCVKDAGMLVFYPRFDEFDIVNYMPFKIINNCELYVKTESFLSADAFDMTDANIVMTRPYHGIFVDVKSWALAHTSEQLSCEYVKSYVADPEMLLPKFTNNLVLGIGAADKMSIFCDIAGFTTTQYNNYFDTFNIANGGELALNSKYYNYQGINELTIYRYQPSSALDVLKEDGSTFFTIPAVEGEAQFLVKLVKSSTVDTSITPVVIRLL